MDPKSILEPVPIIPDGNSQRRFSSMASQPTLYMPIASPPTPAPSPSPTTSTLGPFSARPYSIAQSLSDPAHFSRREFANLAIHGTAARLQYLAAILNECTPSELLFVSTTVTPLLKRDFLRELPPEIAFHVISFLDDTRSLSRAAQVSHRWRALFSDEVIWKRMCHLHQFSDPGPSNRPFSSDISDEEPLEEMEQYAGLPLDPPLQWLTARKRSKRRAQQSHTPSSRSCPPDFSYKEHFKRSYTTIMNWRHGGHLLRSHRVPIVPPDTGVITSVALDADWVVVGLANCRIHIFSTRTGVLSRTLIGHESGVWAVNLVSKGGYWAGGVLEDQLPEQADDGHNLTPSLRTALGLDIPHANAGGPLGEEKRSDVCCTSEGWGQPNALVVSGGCDKVLRVWDAKTGYCIYVLHGHSSTIRCVKVLHNRPIAVSGSRDTTLRVWDVQKGRLLRVLQGHHGSVRCLDIHGHKVVSGSYDMTCRLWDVDTGECLLTLRGHYSQIYSVAFDGERIASGGLDTTVRVWSALTGACLALLQGHTALVCQLQLAPGILATGGSDGRVITFSTATYDILQRIAAHDSSVTSLQFDERFLVTGGNDGRVRLFETATGNYVRDLSELCESVWKVMWRGDTCVVMCKRMGKTVMEIWSFKSREG